MKTYIIQFYQDGNWHNLVDDDKITMEFIFIGTAWKIARTFGMLPEFPLFKNKQWQIKDSNGKIYEMV